jgi:flagellar motor switch/type III secretory pathway protein FliN
MPGKDSKNKQKPTARKATPNGDKKARDPNMKGPSVKKVKIIESIKLHFVQQYFKASDMVYTKENPEPDSMPNPYTFFNEEENGENKPDEDAEEEVQEKPAEEEAPAEEEEEQDEEREPEEHEEYVPPEEDEEEKESSHNFEPYDPNDILEIEVKVSTKVKGLKKMILEKVDLYKKANIIMLKKSE